MIKVSIDAVRSFQLKLTTKISDFESRETKIKNIFQRCIILGMEKQKRTLS